MNTKENKPQSSLIRRSILTGWMPTVALISSAVATIVPLIQPLFLNNMISATGIRSSVHIFLLLVFLHFLGSVSIAAEKFEADAGRGDRFGFVFRCNRGVTADLI